MRVGWIFCVLVLAAIVCLYLGDYVGIGTSLSGSVLDILFGILLNCWESKRNYRALVQKAITECDCNILPGVGCPECQFKLNAIEDLANHLCLKCDLKNGMQKIVQDASLCNAYGSKKRLDPNPGQVKNAFKELRDKLVNLN